MFGIPIQFENPGGLLLALLIIPVLWIGWSHLTAMSTLRRFFVCGMRTLVIVLCALAVSEPKWLDRGEALTVVLLLDRSKSISPQLEQAAIDYLSSATEAGVEGRKNGDRLAVINIGAEARVSTMPVGVNRIEATDPIVELDATNLAHGVRLALAIAPQDTATRIVLASDGNENVDNLLAASDLAMQNEIPIDVLRLTYDHEKEVLFDRIIAPTHVHEGANETVKLVLRSRQETTGRIAFYRNGEVLDLDWSNPEVTSMPVTLREGVNTFSVALTFDESGAQRLRAVFIPDNPKDDPIATNNQAEAVISVSGEGRVLIIHQNKDDSANLRRALAEADIRVDYQLAGTVGSDLLNLSNYDAIILANVPVHALGTKVDASLRQYVHDIGGGLVMLGGPDSFGAGGWIGTEVEKALPLKLDPPEERKMPRGALVCIMHSSEMPNGNYVGQKSAIAAIDALSRLDLAGVIDFNWGAGGNQGCVWEVPLGPVGDKSAAISAIKKMPMGDMPDFAPAMQMALTALTGVRVGQRHVIIISDGDASPPSPALVKQYQAARVTVSTVVAGGHGNAADVQKMKAIAQQLGGQFYNPKRANDMPRIFIKEAMIVRRTLINEADEGFPLHHRSSARPGPFGATWSSLPIVHGYILTAPRPGYDPEIIIANEKSDPLLAHWQYGLGKSVAFTSDASTRWAEAWVSWASFQGFWEQTIRWVMRPSEPANLNVRTEMRGSRVYVHVETTTDKGGFSNFGELLGVVISPDLEDQVLQLEQNDPGKWTGSFDATKEGSWVVNLVRKDADGTRTSTQLGVSVPYSREYRDLTDNAALLTTVAERTNGRVIPFQPDNPGAAALFDRTGLKVPASLSDLWPLFAILAAVCFLLDVATRRLAIDPIAFRRRLNEMMSTRQSAAGESMERLRQTRGDVRSRLGQREGDVATPQAASTKFEAEAGEAGGLIDLDTGEIGDGEPLIQKKPMRPIKKPKADSGSEDGGSYTSRLLAAKQRARQDRLGGSGETKKKGGGDNANG